METRQLAIAASGSIQLAARLLSEGQLVAFPTDTVYGVGANAFDSQAVDQLYRIKGREQTKAIAILIGSREDLSRIVGRMDGRAARLADAFWPGPLTLVLPRHPTLPPNLSPSPNIGVRIPDHANACDLLRTAGPLATTSANRSGMPDARTARQVLEQLGGRIPLILDGGKSPGGKPSTVVDCSGVEFVILRQGPLTLEQLQAAIS